MRQLLKKWGIHQPDEMEQAIRFRAQRNAYRFLITMLLAWSLYEGYQADSHRSRVNPLPCALFAAAVLIQMLSQSIMARNAVKDDVDSYETGPLTGLILWGCAAVSLVAVAVAAAAFMCIKI